MRELRKTRLCRMRRDKDMSLAELGRRAGMDAGMIGWIEKGRFIPYRSQLAKLAEALGYAGNPEDLAEEVEQ